MPNYQLVFLIKPMGMFGLPEEGKIVYPSPAENLLSPTLDTRTGNFVSHGTLSKYRETPLNKAITLAGATLRIADNFVFLEIEAAGEQDAIERGVGIANSFGVLLSVHTDRYCNVDVIQATLEPEGIKIPLPKIFRLTSMTVYNLEELAKRIDETTSAFEVSDDILGKAAAYYYHALFMNEETQSIVNPLSFHGKLIISEVILNYHKAISTIIGDPSIDRDYQSRYRRFGISRQLWGEAEKLRELRNRYDIAHYTPDLSALNNINTHLGFAQRVAKLIIQAYMEWLKHQDMQGDAS